MTKETDIDKLNEQLSYFKHRNSVLLDSIEMRELIIDELRLKQKLMKIEQRKYKNGYTLKQTLIIMLVITSILLFANLYIIL
jgi:hypothetical protein